DAVIAGDLLLSRSGHQQVIAHIFLRIEMSESCKQGGERAAGVVGTQPEEFAIFHYRAKGIFGISVIGFDGIMMRIEQYGRLRRVKMLIGSPDIIQMPFNGDATFCQKLLQQIGRVVLLFRERGSSNQASEQLNSCAWECIDRDS